MVWDEVAYGQRRTGCRRARSRRDAAGGASKFGSLRRHASCRLSAAAHRRSAGGARKRRGHDGTSSDGSDGDADGGITLIAGGLDQHIPKGYIYFAMAFSVLVEILNLRLRKSKTDPVKLHSDYVPESTQTDSA